jgi:Helix-turn-helix of DDE superfamily endonuclease
MPPPPPPYAEMEALGQPLHLPPPLPFVFLPPPPPPPPPLLATLPSHALVKRLFPKVLLLEAETRPTKPVDVWEQWCSHPKTFYERTHVTPDEFEEMHTDLRPFILQPRGAPVDEKLTNQVHNAQLCTRNCFLLVLVWLRDYPTYSALSALFGVNSVFISREIHHFIPLICWRYQHEIQWPDAQQRLRLEGTYQDVSPQTIFAMDYTINKVGVQAKGLEHNFYRSDKNAHFFNSLGAVDFTGILLDYEPGFVGHANDQRGFVLSALGRGDLLLDEGQTGLADGGFSPRDPRILTPYDGTSEVHPCPLVSLFHVTNCVLFALRLAHTRQTGVVLR